MATYVGLSLQTQSGSVRTYSFFTSDASPYGTLTVDIGTQEIILIHAENESAKNFAFPRACRAIQNALTRGILPGQLCFSA